MSARSRSTGGAAGRARRDGGLRAEDPRVLRSRAALVEAALTLFLRQGYAGTTMEDVAEQAGLAKRTVYNNYSDKAALFREIVTTVLSRAEAFARELVAEFEAGHTQATLSAALHDLGRRLGLAILRPEVIALRRLLIGESRSFPELAREYYTRAPGRVLAALARSFARLRRDGVLQAASPRRAAEQFAYLVVGEPLDRAVLTGTLPGRRHVLTCAREGVETFLVRYVPGRG